jgi:Elongation factor Tu GTP binding domain
MQATHLIRSNAAGRSHLFLSRSRALPWMKIRRQRACWSSCALLPSLIQVQLQLQLQSPSSPSLLKTFALLSSPLSEQQSRVVAGNTRLRCFASSSSVADTDDSNVVSILDENSDKIIQQIPLADCRNFCFIAHVDHGKSSLSSRILELTGNLGPQAQRIALEAVRKQQKQEDNGTQDESIVAQDKQSTPPKVNAIQNHARQDKEQYELLDTLAVEQQRGITVKASAATMLYRHPSAIGPTGVLLLNMIDTPGHVDFGSEVERSLSFVQGAVLLLE